MWGWLAHETELIKIIWHFFKTWPNSNHAQSLPLCHYTTLNTNAIHHFFMSICITFFCSFVPFPTLKFNMTKTYLCCCQCLVHSISVYCCPNSQDHRWFNRKTTQVWNSNLRVWHIGLKLNKCHLHCKKQQSYSLVISIMCIHM